MIKVYICPTPDHFPDRGGVREHLMQLYRFMATQRDVSLVDSPYKADVTHVESVYQLPRLRKPMLYVCHGGFVPKPMPAVLENLRDATMIVSVAGWLIGRFFPEYASKSIVIPNGIDLAEFEHIPPSPYGSDYMLYAKEYEYFYDDFIAASKLFPNYRFVSTIHGCTSIESIGLQERSTMRSVVQGASALFLTGSEVCPTMLLEAWACGVPVIANRRDGNAEFIPDGIGGALYADLDSLKQAVEYVMLRRRFIRRQVLELVKPYDWNVIIRRYVTAYRNLLDGWIGI